MWIPYEKIIKQHNTVYYVPLVDVELILPGTPIKEHIRTKAMVDSGSANSLFNIDFLLSRGIDIKNKPFERGTGVGGSHFSTWHFPLEIVCCGKKVKLLQLRFAELKTSPNLLGMNDFFAHFFITFDPRKKGMEIKPRKS